MFEWVRTFFEWFWNLVVSYGQGLWGRIVEAIPSWAPNFAPYTGYLGAADQWFPLSEGVMMLGAYMAFLLVFVVVKMVLKLIPGIG